ncbi:sugar transferase [Cryobacterium melibiosiphilum]|uniref:sugar transferase n=1 Tax=Cryobacterium melibiosiphilum TaxID=995039 RepID=UPI001F1F0989|nr:sugar transferase [Cryobacterium melibiosiphilum]
MPESATSWTSSSVDPNWRDRYARYLMFTDLLVLVWVVFGVQIAWFGFAATDLTITGSLNDVAISYTTLSVIIIAAWMLALGAYGTRGYRVVGTGFQEYRLVADATIRLFGIIALVAFLFKIDFARGYILIAFPLGLLVLGASRWMWRQWLNVQRLNQRFSSRVILVGSLDSVTHLEQELARQPEAGYLVVAVCVPNGKKGSLLNDTQIRISVDLDALQTEMQAKAADTVIVTSSDELAPQRIRELSWSLEPGRQHLVMAPSLTDIGGPRIHTRPVSGLPLIHVETPRYEGRKLFAKRSFDITASALLIMVLSPFLLATAAGVRLSTPGAVLFRQERIGINGKPFQMLKFRSMVSDAESLLSGLQSTERPEGNTVMFKMKNDPRVTPIGRFLRRYSLDELPQLFNVLGGTMSLVGPRPPLEREVGQYETHVHRRFLVKPGITGLWQVSGRSNLSWEDTVRLDLYYVENWSMTGDLIILWRTAKAVLAREGAY